MDRVAVCFYGQMRTPEWFNEYYSKWPKVSDNFLYDFYISTWDDNDTNLDLDFTVKEYVDVNTKLTFLPGNKRTSKAAYLLKRVLELTKEDYDYYLVIRPDYLIDFNNFEKLLTENLNNKFISIKNNLTKLGNTTLVTEDHFFIFDKTHKYVLQNLYQNLFIEEKYKEIDYEMVSGGHHMFGFMFEYNNITPLVNQIQGVLIRPYIFTDVKTEVLSLAPNLEKDADEQLHAKELEWVPSTGKIDVIEKDNIKVHIRNWRLVDDKPLTYAYLETTNYCNLKCSFCNREEVIGALQHMSIKNFRQILEKLKNHPIKEAKLMGMGEPLLHPQFDIICKLFKQYFPDAFLIVATNCQYPINPGTKMHDKFQECMKYIDLLYFSIDGYKESYERDRSPAKWSKLISFLDNFKLMNRFDCKVTCNYVVNPDNVYDIEIINDKIVNKYKLEELRINIAQNWSEDESMPGGYTLQDIDYLRTNWQNNIKGKDKWDFKDCFWVKEGIYVTVEGEVKMCCLNTGARSFGNMLYTDLDRIRTSDRYFKVKNGCVTNKPSEHCVKCSYKELVPLLSKIKQNEKS